MQLFCERCGTGLRGRQRRWCSKPCKDWGVRQAPGYKAKRREWDQAYHQTEEAKAKRQEREHQPTYQAQARARMNTPRAKAKTRARQRTPGYKVQASLRQHLTRQTPEGRVKKREHKHQRRARLASVHFESIPIGWDKEQYADQNGRCYLCGEPLSFSEATRDHIIPLSRSGPHAPSNLALAHGSCNSSKGTKTLEEFRSMDS